MQAIILAAGRGTRMGDLTKNTPKSLLLVNNKTLLEHLLESIPSEITEIIIVVKYLSEKIIKHIGYKYKNVNIKYVKQNNFPGTAGALWATKNFINDRFLVLNGDNLYSKNELKNFINNQICIGVVKRKPLSENYMCIEVDSDKNISGWKYPENNSDIFIASGIYLLDKKIFNYKPQIIGGGEYGLPQTILNMSKDIPVKSVEINYWYSFNSPDDINNFEKND